MESGKMVGFPGGSVIKNPPANAGEFSLISWWGGSPGEGNGNPLQYSCLEGVPDLPVAPQDEAGLTKTFQTWPRGWFHIP